MVICTKVGSNIWILYIRSSIYSYGRQFAFRRIWQKKSAGILLYRVKEKGLEVFLVHPGGPFWKKKDAASWLIPKGEFPDDKDPLVAAIREFREEAGFTPSAPFAPLSPIRQKSGKKVWAWAAAGDLVPALMRSNTVTLEWPDEKIPGFVRDVVIEDENEIEAREFDRFYTWYYINYVINTPVRGITCDPGWLRISGN